jgi:hypothetical protein
LRLSGSHSATSLEIIADAIGATPTNTAPWAWFISLSPAQGMTPRLLFRKPETDAAFASFRIRPTR